MLLRLARGGALALAWLGLAGMLDGGFVWRPAAEAALEPLLGPRRGIAAAAPAHAPLWILDYALIAIAVGVSGGRAYFAPSVASGAAPRTPLDRYDRLKARGMRIALWALGPILIALVLLDALFDQSLAARADRARHKRFFRWIAAFFAGAATLVALGVDFERSLAA